MAGSERAQALQREVEAVRAAMSRNVERVLARGENLEQLHGQSQELAATSQQFQTTSRRVASRYWWRNAKLLVALGLLGAVVLVLVVLLATGVIPT